MSTLSNPAFETTQTTLLLLSHQLKLECFKISESEHAELYSKVLSNRKTYYSSHAPHLLAADELLREQEVDARSYVISVSLNDQVIASLRLTSHPYELADHDSHQFDFRQYTDYLEIGRLVTEPGLTQSNLALIVRYMLCGAGLFAFSKINSPGFVAICRPFRLGIFKKFGLNHHFDLFSEKRKIHYCFLSGTAEEILTATARLQSNEEIFRKRLERIAGIVV